MTNHRQKPKLSEQNIFHQIASKGLCHCPCCTLLIMLKGDQGKNEGEWTVKADIRKEELSAVGEACKSFLSPSLNEKACDSSRFSKKKNFISTSTVLHCESRMYTKLPPYHGAEFRKFCHLTKLRVHRRLGLLSGCSNAQIMFPHKARKCTTTKKFNSKDKWSIWLPSCTYFVSL